MKTISAAQVPVTIPETGRFHYLQNICREKLKKADVGINGQRPWDIRVYNERFFWRVLAQGSLGLGEAYMDGWWDCEALDQLFYKLGIALISGEVQIPWHLRSHLLKAAFLNLQAKSRAFKNVQHHYDIGNDLYEVMLDQRMVYSSAYWQGALSLDEAQEAKLELICQKAGLEPGMRVLDLGCGWGSFVKYAAQHYKVQAVGITVSPNQLCIARQRCEGLPVEIWFQDYRDVTGTYDCVVSLGMLEHVGLKNYRTYMEVVHGCLKTKKSFILQTIGGAPDCTGFDPWLEKYIFPGASIPSLRQIEASIKGLFVIKECENAPQDYDKTLMAWFANFDRHWPELKERYGESFYRIWKYYLLSCAGLFRAHKQYLWRMVLSSVHEDDI